MKSKFILTLVAISFLTQCAKQTAPTGGPKDETPPSITKSEPRNKQINFKGESIELIFDELIQLNNPKEQIIITPSIGKKFDAIAHKNKVTLKFNSPLKENTTYNINFRECVQDLTEKNPALAKLAFSTGGYIDSLSIGGTVKDILSDALVQNYTVGLVEPSDTFNLFKHPGSWITQTDKEGAFIIENLKAGNYFLYAFDDKNRNLITDSKSEKYGFIGENISLTDSLNKINIPVFKLDASNLKLIASRPTFSYFLIRLSKGLSSYSLTATEKNETVHSVLDPDNASIKVYNTIGTLDSLQTRLNAYDSLNNKIDTLLYIKFNKASSSKEKMDYKLERVKYIEASSTLQTTITFSKPITFFRQDSIYLKLDSLNKITFSKENFFWNDQLTKLSINKKYEVKPVINSKQKTKRPETSSEPAQSDRTYSKTYNQLIFEKGAFVSVELDTIPKLIEPPAKISVEETGVILTEVETNNDFILQLLNKANQVMEETFNLKNHKFENITPGVYQLRLIIDVNKNGKWDPGTVKEKKEPEPIFFYFNSKKEKDINIKANWEVGPLLIGG